MFLIITPNSNYITPVVVLIVVSIIHHYNIQTSLWNWLKKYRQNSIDKHKITNHITCLLRFLTKYFITVKTRFLMFTRNLKMLPNRNHRWWKSVDQFDVSLFWQFNFPRFCTPAELIPISFPCFKRVLVGTYLSWLIGRNIFSSILNRDFSGIYSSNFAMKLLISLNIYVPTCFSSVLQSQAPW